MPGVVHALPSLSKRYLLGIVTNGTDDIQRGKLRHLDLSDHIRHLVISANVGYEKPDPRIFACALKLTGVPSSEAVVVGDRLETDVTGANAAGLRAVWLNCWGDEPDADDPEPDTVITSFEQLPDALTSL